MRLNSWLVFYKVPTTMRALLATLLAGVAVVRADDGYGAHLTEYKTSVWTAPVVSYSTSIYESICTTEKTYAPPPVTSIYTSISTYTEPGNKTTKTSLVPYTTTLPPSTYTSLTTYTTKVTDTYSTTYYVSHGHK